MKHMGTENLMYYQYITSDNYFKRKLEQCAAIVGIGAIFLYLFLAFSFAGQKLLVTDMYISSNEFPEQKEQKAENEYPTSTKGREAFPLLFDPVVSATLQAVEERAEVTTLTGVQNNIKADGNIVIKPPYKEETDGGKEDIGQAPSAPTVAITYQGQLRMDYGIGSEIDMSQIKIQSTVDKESTEIALENCVITGIDTQSVGKKELTVEYEDTTLRIPYGIAEYKIYLDANGGALTQTEVLLDNYTLDTTTLGTPDKLGKEFVGWYRDITGTISFERADVGETAITLHAFYREWPNIVCDENGYIVTYTGGVDTVVDFVLNIPNIKNVKGIINDPFFNIGATVMEVFVPDTIEYIAPNAFDSLITLFYAEVESTNPVYYSKEGIIYERETDEIVLYPKGRLAFE